MDELLRKVQLTELEILEVIADFCSQNQIGYSLCGGSLIGAIRHGGFIPWDDDIDILMKRNDLDRFISLWQNDHPDGYLLQTKEINAPDIEISFVKIRKDNTTFLQFETERGKHHVGIFVDIFPLDRMPSGKLQKLFFYWHCIKYQLYVREFVPPNANVLVKCVTKLLLITSTKESRKKKRRQLLKKITKYNDDESLEAVAIETLKSMRITYSPDIMDSLVPIRFEGKEFLCFKKWKEYLEKFYGDYMKLPPIEERKWAHHPIIIDFEHNYEDLNCTKK